jgi:DNA-binding GntR family transcriptional regulator
MGRNGPLQGVHIEWEVLDLRSGEELICGSVYDYFEARILTGLFRNDEKLPPILELSEAFRLAPETIRSALMMLEEDGYIRMEAKLGTWVVYQAEPEERKKNIALYYAARYDGIQDLFRSGLYLLEPLLLHSLRHMDDSCWSRLLESLKPPQDDQIIPFSIQLYARVLSALNNSLVLNLYWEVDRYLRFSCLFSKEAYNAIAPEQFAKDRETRAAQFDAALHRAARDSGDQLLDACRKARAQYPAQEQVPFHWRIYRQRRQLCYTLAARIIRRIAAGTYQPGSYLPPLLKMADELDVSLSTLRRTLSILSSLGVTRSFHGKGTLVCMEVENIEFSRTEIKEGLWYFWESLQFLSLTAAPVTLFMLQTMSEEERADLTAQFVQMCELNSCHRCYDITLRFIVERCSFAMVRECYGKLQEFLAWGYPFTVYRLRNHSLQSEYAETIRQAADCLVRRDWEGFAGEYGALMAREAKLAETILTDYCK